jgi:hypothetical protein
VKPLRVTIHTPPLACRRAISLATNRAVISRRVFVPRVNEWREKNVNRAGGHEKAMVARKRTMDGLFVDLESQTRSEIKH